MIVLTSDEHDRAGRSSRMSLRGLSSSRRAVAADAF